MEKYNVELMENLSNGIWYIKRDADTFKATVIASKLDEIPQAINKAKFEPYREVIHKNLDKYLAGKSELVRKKVKSGVIMKIILDSIAGVE